MVAAERLAGFFGDTHQITLVAPDKTFTFYPALVRLAFGQLEEEDVTFDLSKKLGKIGVKFIEGEVLQLKPEAKSVQITGNEFSGDLSYDFLVIAMGRRLATEKLYGFFDHAQHLLGIEAAIEFGKTIDQFTRGKIVVGLSPDAFLPVPVCETAFLLANRFFPDSPTRPVSITVVFPETVKDAFGGADIHKELKSAFSNHQIDLIENFPINKIVGKKIISSNGREIPYDLLMLIPPFRGRARLSDNGITDDQNFVEVDEFMRVKGLKNTYAVGDIVSFPGPKLAQIAVRQADVAAVNIMREVEDRKPEAVYYHEIASIIDQGGPDSIYLHYGVWDDSLYRLKRGTIWGMVKRVHDKIWRTKHKVS